MSTFEVCEERHWTVSIFVAIKVATTVDEKIGDTSIVRILVRISKAIFIELLQRIKLFSNPITSGGVTTDIPIIIYGAEFVDSYADCFTALVR